MNDTPAAGGPPTGEPPAERGERRRRRRGRNERRRRQKRRRRGADLAGLTGLLIGIVIGLPLGLLAYLVLREAVLPYSLWGSETAMWAIIFGVTVPAALLGLVQGAMPSRPGHALLVGLVAFLLGSLVFGTLGAIATLFLGEAPEVPEDPEDVAGLALGVAFGLMPLVAAMGGVAVAAFWGYRAWRSWGAWTGERAR
ncbi:MAG TPA: hypothetical protein VGN83_16880 [Falsiroseomonas sp.]|jgi:hypothetical protein|nr:hypothetical protein [Falsiroseomonas sp.]